MSDWEILETELNAWKSENRIATLWWRDDDAAEVTPALERLLRIGKDTGTPIALAVIPDLARPELAAVLNGESGISVLQHGYRHQNHEPIGTKANELGSARDGAAVLAELKTGYERLSGFERRLPVLTPPWNRIDPALLPHLPGLGFAGISTFGPRRAAEAAPGLVQVNTHVDVIKWRQERRFLGVAASLAECAEHLRARRMGAIDPEEPTGLLTHHLVHDESCWAFLEEFAGAAREHPAARWLDPAKAFGV